MLLQVLRKPTEEINSIFSQQQIKTFQIHLKSSIITIKEKKN